MSSREDEILQTYKKDGLTKGGFNTVYYYSPVAVVFHRLLLHQAIMVSTYLPHTTPLCYAHIIYVF